MRLFFGFILIFVESEDSIETEDVKTVCHANSMALEFPPGYFNLDNFVKVDDLYMNGPTLKVGPATGSNGMFEQVCSWG